MFYYNVQYSETIQDRANTCEMRVSTPRSILLVSTSVRFFVSSSAPTPNYRPYPPPPLAFIIVSKITQSTSKPLFTGNQDTESRTNINRACGAHPYRRQIVYRCVSGSTQIIPSRSDQGYPHLWSQSRTPAARRSLDAPRSGSCVPVCFSSPTTRYARPK